MQKSDKDTDLGAKQTWSTHSTTSNTGNTRPPFSFIEFGIILSIPPTQKDVTVVK